MAEIQDLGVTSSQDSILGDENSFRILRFCSEKSLDMDVDRFSTFDSNENIGFQGVDESSVLSAPYQQQRKIARTPFKVLDAPALQDDYYLNLLDWSNQNVLAVGLGSCVYLWSASNSKVTKLHDLGSQGQVSSISWSLDGNYLAVGTSTGEL